MNIQTEMTLKDLESDISSDESEYRPNRKLLKKDSSVIDTGNGTLRIKKQVAGESREDIKTRETDARPKMVPIYERLPTESTKLEKLIKVDKKAAVPVPKLTNLGFEKKVEKYFT